MDQALYKLLSSPRRVLWSTRGEGGPSSLSRVSCKPLLSINCCPPLLDCPDGEETPVVKIIAMFSVVFHIIVMNFTTKILCTTMVCSVPGCLSCMKPCIAGEENTNAETLLTLQNKVEDLHIIFLLGGGGT